MSNASAKSSAVLGLKAFDSGVDIDAVGADFHPLAYARVGAIQLRKRSGRCVSHGDGC